MEKIVVIAANNIRPFLKSRFIHLQRFVNFRSTDFSLSLPQKKFNFQNLFLGESDFMSFTMEMTTFKILYRRLFHGIWVLFYRHNSLNMLIFSF